MGTQPDVTGITMPVRIAAANKIDTRAMIIAIVETDTVTVDGIGIVVMCIAAAIAEPE